MRIAANKAALCFFCVATILSGCSKQQQNTTETTAEQSKIVTPKTASIQGHVSLGVVEGALIDVYSVDTLGQTKSLLAETQTDAQGAFTASVEVSEAMTVVVQARLDSAQWTCPLQSGCYQLDYAQKGSFATPLQLKVLLPDVMDNSQYQVELSPFSDMLFHQSEQRSLQYGTDIETVWRSQSDQLALLLAGINPVATQLQGDWASMNDKQRLYRALNRALLQQQNAKQLNWQDLSVSWRDMLQTQTGQLAWNDAAALPFSQLLQSPEIQQLNNPLLAHWNFTQTTTEPDAQNNTDPQTTDTNVDSVDTLDALSQVKAFVQQLRNWLQQLALFPQQGASWYQQLQASNVVLQQSKAVLQQQLLPLIQQSAYYFDYPDELVVQDGYVYVGNYVYQASWQYGADAETLELSLTGVDDLQLSVTLQKSSQGYLLQGEVQSTQAGHFTLNLTVDQAITQAKLVAHIEVLDALQQPVIFDGTLGVQGDLAAEVLNKVTIEGTLQSADVAPQTIAVVLEANAQQQVDTTVSIRLDIPGLPLTDVTVNAAFSDAQFQTLLEDKVKLVLSDADQLMMLTAYQQQGAISLFAENHQGIVFSYQQAAQSGDIRYQQQSYAALTALNDSLIKVTYTDGTIESVF